MRTCRAQPGPLYFSIFRPLCQSVCVCVCVCKCACVLSNFKIVVFNQSRFARDLGKQQHLNSHSTINPPIASNRRRHQHLWRKGARNAGRNARRKWDGEEKARYRCLSKACWTASPAVDVQSSDCRTFGLFAMQSWGMFDVYWNLCRQLSCGSHPKPIKEATLKSSQR